MGGGAGGAIVPRLRRLTEGGIEVHAQIVLCPGINDWRVLEATVRDLAELHPGLGSVGVVPVGLTRFTKRPDIVRPVGPSEAAEALAQIDAMQSAFTAHLGTRFVFASDEFYLRAGVPLPGADAYEDFPQLANGIGLIASFRAEEDEALGRIAGWVAWPRHVSVVTGTDAAPTLSAFCERLSRLAQTKVAVLPVRNEFFGESVTVAGLLTGQDISAALRSVDMGDVVLVPDVAFRDGRVLLDDMTLDDLQECVGVPVRVAAATPHGIVEALLEPEP
jgi:putative radical SAM enzyme (TIGR03279 family)